MYRNNFKTFIDIIFTFIVLFLLSPLLLFLYILVCFVVGRPVIFKQSRPGLDGKKFKLFKFRTMFDKFDEQGKLKPDEQRLAKFGKFLRSTSLDELPELLNVLKGDMSLVGPRPLLTEYLPLYSTEQARRHEVKPGITGWAQVNGRNAITWEEKFKFDVWYVDNLSFWLDFKIILLTLYKVFRREGISAKDEATMPLFKGTKN